MKKILTLLLCFVLALCSISFMACDEGDASESTSESGSSSPSSEEPTGGIVIVNGVEAPAWVSLFRTNSGKKAEDAKETEFFVLNDTYKVGDVNEFVFKPTVHYIDEDRQPVLPESEEFTFSVELKEQDEEDETKFVYTQVGVTDEKGDYIESFNTETCAFNFSANAVGKTFRLNVAPVLSGEQQTDLSEYTVSFEVEVVEGYNVYTVREFGYINNYDLRNTTDASEGQKGWVDYRAKKEYALTADQINELKGVVMHSDISITAEDFPSSFIYGEDEAPNGNKNLIGSVKDEFFSAIFYRYLNEDESFGLYGNYYTIDANKIPYVYYSTHTDSSGKPMLTKFDNNGNIIENNVTSHTTLLRFEGKGMDSCHSYMENVNVIGNSPRTAELAAMGGIIFFKTQKCDTRVNNVISRKLFITMFIELNNGALYVNNMKCYDSFNSPIYNWGNDNMYFDNVIIKNAGGPAIIADAIDADGGISPRIIAKNCVFENYVTGSEAWFVMAGATTLVTQMKGLDIIPRTVSQVMQQMTQNPNIPTMTFLKDDAEGVPNYMNIYVVVKSDGNIIANTSNGLRAYIEINGCVMDYGTGAVKDTDMHNGATAAMDKATYMAEMQTAIGTHCALGRPVIETNIGGALYLDQQATQLTDMVKPANSIAANNYGGIINTNKGTVNVYYNTGSLFGVLGIMLDYFPAA